MSIPEWLKPYFKEKCSCGAEILNSYNLTQRKCSNFYCPEHMKHRAVIMAKYLGVMNVGPATAADYLSAYHLKCHVQLIPIWFEEPPELYLWEIGKLAFIPRLSEQWKELASDCYTFEEVLMKPRMEWLKPWLNYLNFVKKFFKVKKPLAKTTIKVMLTGSILGYSNRGNYIRALNEKYGQYFQIMDIGKRKSNCDFLIKEEFTVDHSKSALAASANIPIVTSAQFNAFLAELMERREA